MVYKVNAQIVTIHGSSTPVTLYQISDAGFQQIITSEMWINTDGGVAVAIPYSLQQTTPPIIDGTPIVDFRPMTCYECRVAYGRTSTLCGPWHDWIEGGRWAMKCNDINDAACRLEFTDANGQKYVIFNPHIE